MTATLSTADRRNALRLGIINGALWSIGNGLTTGPLILYAALELGARGWEIGLILALQSLVGVLRLAAPTLINWLGGVKRTTILLFSLSYCLLATLPIVNLRALADDERLLIFVLLLAVHQLLESLATVALWSWLGWLVPPRLRGRYFATRQKWQLACLVPTAVAGGLFVEWWNHGQHAAGDAIVGYTLPIGLGAIVLLLSVVPLLRMPAMPWTPATAGGRQSPLFSGFAPLFDGRFQRLLFFGCWLSFIHGLTQSAAGIYPKRALALGVLPLMLLTTGMRLGQIALAPWAGRFSDRYGNRPTMFCCQALVACGPLCYLVATPDQPWWIGGAFLLWSAYVGLNICLPNLTLKLAAPGQSAAYVGVYFAATGVSYGLSTLLGGQLLDVFSRDSFYVGNWRFDNYHYLFYIGWILRLVGLVWILGIDEPGAWTWREIWRGQRPPPSADEEP